jgi:hypothetical protein
VSAGTRPVGSVLTCDPGEWRGSGTVAFQWFVDGEPVPSGKGEGETGSANPKRFRCQASHVGRKITCTVTKTNQHGSTTVETEPIVVVEPQAVPSSHSRIET